MGSARYFRLQIDMHLPEDSIHHNDDSVRNLRMKMTVSVMLRMMMTVSVMMIMKTRKGNFFHHLVEVQALEDDC